MTMHLHMSYKSNNKYIHNKDKIYIIVENLSIKSDIKKTDIIIML